MPPAAPSTAFMRFMSLSRLISAAGSAAPWPAGCGAGPSWAAAFELERLRFFALAGVLGPAVDATGSLADRLRRGVSNSIVERGGRRRRRSAQPHLRKASPAQGGPGQYKSAIRLPGCDQYQVPRECLFSAPSIAHARAPPCPRRVHHGSPFFLAFSLSSRRRKDTRRRCRPPSPITTSRRLPWTPSRRSRRTLRRPLRLPPASALSARRPTSSSRVTWSEHL